MKRIADANAGIIVPAIAAVEKVTEVTSGVLDNLGVGLDDASTFDDADTEEEKTAWIQKYAIALVVADKGAIKKIVVPPAIVDSDEKKAARVIAVARMSTAIFGTKVAPKTKPDGSATTQNITVVAKTEEESSYTHDFPGSELELQQEMCNNAMTTL